MVYAIDAESILLLLSEFVHCVMNSGTLFVAVWHRPSISCVSKITLVSYLCSVDRDTCLEL